MLDQGDPAVYEIWPENVAALELFLRLRTQWRVGALGGVLGFDYQGVAAVMGMTRVKRRHEVFEDLQAMEIAALDILNEKP